MSCLSVKETGNHDFDWDKSQVCPDCGIKERDFLDERIQKLEAIVKDLSDKNVSTLVMDYISQGLDIHYQSKIQELEAKLKSAENALVEIQTSGGHMDGYEERVSSIVSWYFENKKTRGGIR